MRARKRERLKQRYSLSLLSFVSKQMSTRLFSLLQYKGPLTKTHTQACTHIIPDKSMHSGFSNFPRCFALPSPLGEQGDKASQGGEDLLLSALLFYSPCLHSFFSLFPLLISAYWLFSTLCSTFTQYAIFSLTDIHIQYIAGITVRCLP